MKTLLVLTFLLFTAQSFSLTFAQAVQRPELIVQTGHTRPVHALTFSPDGKLIASGGWDNSVKLWDVATGRELRTIIPPGPIDSLIFSPDGKTLAGNWSDTIILWEVNSGRELARLTGHTENINSIAFSPDGKTLASGSEYYKDMDHAPTIKLWDVVSGNEIRTITGHNGGIYSVAFSPNGKILASGARNAAIKLWDTSSGRELRSLVSNPETPYAGGGQASVTFSADGALLVSGSQYERVGPSNGNSSAGANNSLRSVSKVRVWDVASGRELRNVDFSENASSENDFTISPDGRFLALPSGKAVELIDLTSGQKLLTLAGHQEEVNVVAFSPDGKTLASGSGNNEVRDNTVRLWDVMSGRQLHILTGDNYKLSNVIVDLHGTVLANTDISIFGRNADTSTKAIKLWDLVGGRGLATLIGHSKLINETVLSPDGTVLASGDDSGLIKLWDVQSGNSTYDLVGHEQFISSLAFDSSGKILASGSGDKTIKLWDMTTRRESHILSGHKQRVEILAFSPDDKILASAATDSEIKLWDVNSGRELRVFNADSRVTDVAFSLDRKVLAAGTRHNTVMLWDLATGRQLHAFNASEVSDTGVSVAFSGDGKLVASDDEYSVIKVWEISSGKELETLDRFAFSTVQKMSATVPAIYRKSFDDPLIANDRLQARTAGIAKIQILDVKSGRELLTLTALGENDWAIVTPEGRFDTSRLEAPQGLHWILPDSPFAALSFEVFMRDYYEPRLLPRLLKCNEEGNCGQEFRPIRNLTKLNHTQPAVTITNIKATARPDTVEVSVEVNSVVSEYQKDQRGEGLTSGVYDVRLFRDGQLVGHSTSDESLQSTFRAYKDFDEELAVWRNAHMVAMTAGKKTLTFKAKLPNNPANGRVEFSAYAFNEDRVKSETARVTYAVPADARRAPEPRRAYVIAFGANKYGNPEWELRFAANDAQAMGRTVVESLRARREFAEVVEIPLISDRVTASGKTFDKLDATKSNVRTVLELLSGKVPPTERLRDLEAAVGSQVLRAIRQVTPDDFVLLFFSSHGYADQNGVFYIVPSDIDRESRKRVTAGLLGRSISSDELSLWLRDIDSDEMVMIVDACHAASAVEGGEFKPGPMGARGLGQLAFDKGMKILAATQADNVALENNLIRQGLLTYALVQDGLEARQADYKPKDKAIGVGEWLSYGVERVPQLYEEVRSGRIQDFGGDVGQQTKVVITARNGRNYSRELKEMVTAARAQQPSLFDFKRNKKEVILSVLE